MSDAEYYKQKDGKKHLIIFFKEAENNKEEGTYYLITKRLLLLSDDIIYADCDLKVNRSRTYGIKTSKLAITSDSLSLLSFFHLKHNWMRK